MKNKALKKKLLTVILSDQDMESLLIAAKKNEQSVSRFVRIAINEKLQILGYLTEKEKIKKK